MPSYKIKRKNERKLVLHSLHMQKDMHGCRMSAFGPKAQKKMRHASGFFNGVSRALREGWCISQEFPLRNVTLIRFWQLTLLWERWILSCLHLGFWCYHISFGTFKSAGWYIFIMRARHQEEFFVLGHRQERFSEIIFRDIKYIKRRAHQRMRGDLININGN
jgi:hypothetical protein